MLAQAGAAKNWKGVVMEGVEELRRQIEVLAGALEFIANNPPETPAEYAVMRDVARRALDYDYGD